MGVSLIKSHQIVFIALSVITPWVYAMQPVAILTGGIENSLGQQSQSLTFANTLFQYQPDSTSALIPLVGGFAGMEYSFNDRWAWQFGLAFYQSVSSSISGEETQAPIEFPEAVNIWNYQYQVLSRQLLVENKLSFAVQKIYHPYLLVGLGESFNKAYAFQVTPQNAGEVATAVYGSNTSHSFVYTAGLGIDINVSEQIRIGAGYRYAYLGSYDLGEGTLDTGAGGEVFLLPALKSNHAYNQEVLIQLTYLFKDQPF